MGTSRLEKEPEFRYNIFNGEKVDPENNKEDFETDAQKYLKFLNSFEGLTNIEKYEHNCLNGKLIDFDYPNIQDKTILPFQVLIFENREIAEDAFSFLIYYI